MQLVINSVFLSWLLTECFVKYKVTEDIQFNSSLPELMHKTTTNHKVSNHSQTVEQLTLIYKLLDIYATLQSFKVIDTTQP